MNPILSVIIPVYNAEKHLYRCINSVIEQTYKDLELILLDDGSVDGSLQVCHQYAARDNRIKVISQPNQGVSKARNVGIEHANGQYITFIDSDDYIANDTFDIALNYLLEHNLDVVAYGMLFDYFTNEALARTEIHVIKNNLVIENNQLGSCFLYLYENNYLSSACNKIYRMSIITKNILRFDSNMAIYEDLAFVLDTMYYGASYGAINKPLYHYCHDLSVYHINKRPNIDYVNNFTILSGKLLRVIGLLGIDDPDDSKKMFGYIFRFYLLGLEKIVSSNKRIGQKYTDFKDYYLKTQMRDSVIRAKCRGYRLNIILSLFKCQCLLGAFLILHLNNMYITARNFWRSKKQVTKRTGNKSLSGTFISIF